jgi:lipopolysaccharide exporter
VSIARQAAHGVAWNMALGVSSRVLQLVGTLILTRFIAPDDYGSVLTASITVITIGAFTSFSFGQYLIAKRATPEVAMQAMVVYVGIGVIAQSGLYLLRDPLGALFDAPDMGKYVLGFAVAQLLDRVRYVPERLLMRALRFRALATINGLGEIAYTIAAVATAHAWGAYAIMFGALARAAVTAILFVYAAPRAEWLVRLRLRAADVRDLFAYGIPLMIAIVTDRAATRWDNLIMSKLFNPGVMGRYNLAYSLAEMPIINVAEHIGEVLMPSFSRMEPDQRPRAAVRAAGLMGLVVSPLGVGLGAIAPTVVATFFDARWAMMAPMLTILSIMTVFRPMIWSVLSFAQAAQNTRIVMISSFVRAAVVLSMVAVGGALGGPNWACVGAGIGYVLHAALTILIGGHTVGLPAAAYVRAVARPLLPCIPMYVAVVALQHGLATAGAPRVVSLAAQVMVGAIIYIASAFALCRPGVDELLRIGRDAIRSRRAR